MILATTARFLEPAHGRAAGQERAVQVDVHGPPPFVEIHLVARPHRAVDSRVVHQEWCNVSKTASAVAKSRSTSSGEETSQPSAITRWPGKGTCACRDSARSTAGLFVARAEEDAGPLAHESLDDGAAQPLAASGDDRVAVGELHKEDYAAGVPTAKYSTQWDLVRAEIEETVGVHYDAPPHPGDECGPVGVFDLRAIRWRPRRRRRRKGWLPG